MIALIRAFLIEASGYGNRIYINDLPRGRAIEVSKQT